VHGERPLTEHWTLNVERPAAKSADSPLVAPRQALTEPASGDFTSAGRLPFWERQPRVRYSEAERTTSPLRPLEAPTDSRRQALQAFLRRTHLLSAADETRMLARSIRLAKKNRAFEVVNREFALPPRHIANDALSSVDWTWFKASGEWDADRIVGLMEGHGMPSPRSVLEWGCGPARVIRHLPARLPQTMLVGSDYNAKSIDWCSRTIRGVKFVLNGLNPPLPFDDGSFSCVYAASVVTHLSEETATAWMRELARVTEPRGLLLLWTNGTEVARSLLPEERRSFEAGHCVTRSGAHEGRKWYLAVHPPSWVRDSLLRDFTVEEYLPGGGDVNREQDIWVARR